MATLTGTPRSGIQGLQLTICEATGTRLARTNLVAAWLTSKVLLPAHESLMRRQTLAALQELLSARHLSADAIAALQSQKLRRLLTHAHTRVPWYREAALKLVCDPAHDDPWQLLSSMPLVSRSELQAQGERFVSEGTKGLVAGWTSGSSGEPLRFYVDAAHIAADKAARYRAQMDWGVGVGDRKVWLWGQPVSPSWKDHLKTARDRVMRESTLNAYRMTDARMRNYIHLLGRWRPSSVTCYPTAAWRLCQFALDEKLNLKQAGVSVWFTTGEMLQPHHRSVVEEASGGRVANEYGLREAGFLAHECRHGTMHVTPESVFLETIRPDGSAAGDQLGEIVVTNLDNLGMPLVRYRTRDYGRLARASCQCGWSTQTLTELVGRQSDFLITSNGVPIVGFALSRQFWDVAGVRQFRVVQESLSDTRVLIVGSEAFDEGSRRRIHAMIQGALGSDVNVAVDSVDTIPAAPSGKTGYIQSNIALEYL